MRDKEKKEFDMFIKNVIESDNYISQKNQMLIHLSDRSIWNLIFKSFKDSIDRKPTKSFNEFIYNLNTEPTMKEQIVEDQEKATLIGIAAAVVIVHLGFSFLSNYLSKKVGQENLLKIKTVLEYALIILIVYFVFF